MKAYVKGFFLGFAALFCFSFVVMMADYQGYFNLKSFDYSILPNKRMQGAAIFDLYKASSSQAFQGLRGKSLLGISVAGIRDSLMQEEWVEAVHIRRVFPKSLKIEVVPKEWWAYFEKDSQFYPLTKSGDLLGRVPVLQGPDLPLIRLSEKDFHLYKHIIMQVLKRLPEEALFSFRYLQEIGRDREGLYFVIQPDHMKVRVGTENLDLRMARVEKVLHYLKDHDLQGRVINADFTQKVVVKLRKAR
tara:strand:- start:14070 stop:14807 length:738 start_codon:yes stop_codon:yes gene_type:complete